MGGPPRKQQKRDSTATDNLNSLSWSTPSPPRHVTCIGASVIPTINKLQDILSCLHSNHLSQISLPHVAVIGSQSSVSPANSDLATSDALQMSKQLDPKDKFTLCWRVQLDIMDRGTDACNFLLGKVIPLRLGYIGVINRCQEDINKNKSVAEALSFEEQFFRNHHEYHDVQDRCGIPQLSKKLNQILEQHIRANLPALKSQIKSHFHAVEEELRTYGDGVESKVS
ncbi:hypothetical protein KSS87_013707 [Heliosperma pusillum]|nr:hypothetical protein KSS87_013707 [Heliosperma pusillum]